jgi:hypothetical protein
MGLIGSPVKPILFVDRADIVDGTDISIGDKRSPFPLAGIARRCIRLP